MQQHMAKLNVGISEQVPMAFETKPMPELPSLQLSGGYTKFDAGMEAPVPDKRSETPRGFARAQEPAVMQPEQPVQYYLDEHGLAAFEGFSMQFPHIGEIYANMTGWWEPPQVPMARGPTR